MDLQKPDRPLLWTTFSLYLILAFWIIALKFNAEWLPELGEYFRALPLWERVGRRIIPFYGMIKSGWYFDKDYFMNVVIYLPLGIYLPFLLPARNKYLHTAWIIPLSSILFEFLQLVTGFGGCDGTDVVCNTLGGFLGLLTYAVLLKRLSPKAVNAVNIAVILLLALPAGYAVVNTLLHLELYRIY